MQHSPGSARIHQCLERETIPVCRIRKHHRHARFQQDVATVGDGGIGEFHIANMSQIKTSYEGGRFDANGKRLSYRSEDVRTWKEENMQTLAREIILHLLSCEEECPQLDGILGNIFGIVSAYQKKAV